MLEMKRKVLRKFLKIASSLKAFKRRKETGEGARPAQKVLSLPSELSDGLGSSPRELEPN